MGNCYLISLHSENVDVITLVKIKLQSSSLNTSKKCQDLHVVDITKRTKRNAISVHAIFQLKTNSVFNKCIAIYLKQKAKRYLIRRYIYT